MRVVRAALVSAAAAGSVLMVFVAANQARFGSVHFVRFREITLGIEIALFLALVVRRDPRAALGAWAARLEGLLASPRFFGAASFTMLALFVLSALTQHWAFRTSSHDFSMIDEALDRSLHGPFLFSPVLGRSFLSEHFSPILALLVPLHALFRTPYLLILIQPLALWASGLALRGLLRDQGVPDSLAALACVLYWNHARMVSTLDYLFHMECLLPLGLFVLFRLRKHPAGIGYWVALLLTLSIKEDVGLYVAGVGIWMALAERRRALGAATTLVSLAWSIAAVQFAIPAFAGGASYAFADRWASWGHGWGGILIGFATRPASLARALFATPYLRFFASLLLLPFASRWGWTIVMAPWILNATSSLEVQSSLSLYYGIPLLACAAIATALALAPASPARSLPRAAGLGLAALAIVLDVSHLSFPAIPRERGAVLRAIAAIPDTSLVQLMPCFDPVAGYERRKVLLFPGENLVAAHVVLRTKDTTWPFTEAAVESLADAAVRSGKYRDPATFPGFHVLERRAP